MEFLPPNKLLHHYIVNCNDLTGYLANKATVFQNCTSDFVQKLLKLIDKELKQPIVNTDFFIQIFELIQHICQFSYSPNGIPNLFKGGFGKKMVSIFYFVMDALRKDPTLTPCLEDMLETILAISEHHPSVQKIIIPLFVGPFIKSVMDATHCGIKVEIVKYLNLLLTTCSVDIRYAFQEHEDNKELLKKLANMIECCGDYGFQASITEALFRLTPNSTRKKLAYFWFSIAEVKQAFLDIAEREFEMDCRKFLNFINAWKKTVFSYPCKNIKLSSLELYKPSDYNDFWIDFNMGSRSISFFCEDVDNALWETVIIKHDSCEKYSIRENCTQLEIILKNSVSELISFGSNLKGNIATIIFNNSITELKMIMQKLCNIPILSKVSECSIKVSNIHPKTHISVPLEPLRISCKAVDNTHLFKPNQKNKKKTSLAKIDESSNSKVSVMKSPNSFPSKASGIKNKDSKKVTLKKVKNPLQILTKTQPHGATIAFDKCLIISNRKTFNFDRCKDIKDNLLTKELSSDTRFKKNKSEKKAYKEQSVVDKNLENKVIINKRNSPTLQESLKLNNMKDQSNGTTVKKNFLLKVSDARKNEIAQIDVIPESQILTINSQSKNLSLKTTGLSDVEKIVNNVEMITTQAKKNCQKFIQVASSCESDKELCKTPTKLRNDYEICKQKSTGNYKKGRYRLAVTEMKSNKIITRSQRKFELNKPSKENLNNGLFTEKSITDKLNEKNSESKCPNINKNYYSSSLENDFSKREKSLQNKSTTYLSGGTSLINNELKSLNSNKVSEKYMNNDSNVYNIEVNQSDRICHTELKLLVNDSKLYEHLNPRKPIYSKYKKLNAANSTNSEVNSSKSLYTDKRKNIVKEEENKFKEYEFETESESSKIAAQSKLMKSAKLMRTKPANNQCVNKTKVNFSIFYNSNDKLFKKAHSKITQKALLNKELSISSIKFDTKVQEKESCDMECRTKKDKLKSILKKTSSDKSTRFLEKESLPSYKLNIKEKPNNSPQLSVIDAEPLNEFEKITHDYKTFSTHAHEHCDVDAVLENERRIKNKVDYAEISDSGDKESEHTVLSSESKRSKKKTSFHEDITHKLSWVKRKLSTSKNKRSRSIYSDFDSTSDTKSDVSWLTGSKLKRRNEKKFLKYTRRSNNFTKNRWKKTENFQTKKFFKSKQSILLSPVVSDSESEIHLFTPTFSRTKEMKKKRLRPKKIFSLSSDNSFAKMKKQSPIKLPTRVTSKETPENSESEGSDLKYLPSLEISYNVPQEELNDVINLSDNFDFEESIYQNETALQENNVLICKFPKIMNESFVAKEIKMDRTKSFKSSINAKNNNDQQVIPIHPNEISSKEIKISKRTKHSKTSLESFNAHENNDQGITTLLHNETLTYDIPKYSKQSLPLKEAMLSEESKENGTKSFKLSSQNSKAQETNNRQPTTFIKNENLSYNLPIFLKDSKERKGNSKTSSKNFNIQEMNSQRISTSPRNEMLCFDFSKYLKESLISDEIEINGKNISSKTSSSDGNFFYNSFPMFQNISLLSDKLKADLSPKSLCELNMIPFENNVKIQDCHEEITISDDKEKHSADNQSQISHISSFITISTKSLNPMDGFLKDMMLEQNYCKPMMDYLTKKPTTSSYLSMQNNLKRKFSVLADTGDFNGMLPKQHCSKQGDSIFSCKDSATSLPGIYTSSCASSLNCTTAVENVLQSLGECFNNKMKQKHKHLECFTDSALKTAEKRISNVFVGQKEEREHILKNFIQVLHQEICVVKQEMSKLKLSDEKMASTFFELQKLSALQRLSEKQRVQSLQELADNFADQMKLHENNSNFQQVKIKGHIAKEINHIQDNILQKSQQEQIAVMKRNIRHLLS